MANPGQLILDQFYVGQPMSEVEEFCKNSNLTHKIGTLNRINLFDDTGELLVASVASDPYSCGLVNSISLIKSVQDADFEFGELASGMRKSTFLEAFPNATLVRSGKTYKGEHSECFRMPYRNIERCEIAFHDEVLTFVMVKPDIEAQCMDAKASQQASREDRLKAAWANRKTSWPIDFDANADLRKWAASYQSFNQDDDWNDLAEWLINNSTPDQRHLFVENYNWDHGLVPLRWIASQPDTERATVLEIFWLGEPHHYDDALREKGFVEPHEEEAFDFLAGITRRLESGFYRQPKGFLGMKRKPIAFSENTPFGQHSKQDLANSQMFSQLVFDPIAGRPLGRMSPEWPVAIN